jgi:hypothetical protein
LVNSTGKPVIGSVYGVTAGVLAIGDEASRRYHV